MLAALDENYRVPTPRRLIYNGRRFTPSTVHGHRAFVFAAGRMWDEAKNLRAVVEAAPSIEWPVRIAGDGGADSENLTYLGWLEPADLARAYGESAIYLLPALYEPFGLSVLEAALSGCALVLGDIPSLREIWRDAAPAARRYTASSRSTAPMARALYCSFDPEHYFPESSAPAETSATSAPTATTASRRSTAC